MRYLPFLVWYWARYTTFLKPNNYINTLQLKYFQSKKRELNSSYHIKCPYFSNKSTTFLIWWILYKFAHSAYFIYYDDDKNQECLFLFYSILGNSAVVKFSWKNRNEVLFIYWYQAQCLHLFHSTKNSIKEQFNLTSRIWPMTNVHPTENTSHHPQENTQSPSLKVWTWRWHYCVKFPRSR